MTGILLKHPVDFLGSTRMFAEQFSVKVAHQRVQRANEGCKHATHPKQHKSPVRSNCPRFSTKIRVFFSRSDINLHLHKCKNKACKCEVTGCGRIVMRKDMERHLQEAALSHYNLQLGEIQRLRQQIHEKVKPERLF